MNKVEINNERPEADTWLEKLEVFAVKAMDAALCENWDLSILICGDQRIQELNAQWRDKDEPTDVLSFECGDEYIDDTGETRYLAGDIAISLDTLAKNAEYFSVDTDEELRRLLIHGILHLSGEDHADNDPSQAMLQKQEELLRYLNKEGILK